MKTHGECKLTDCTRRISRSGGRGWCATHYSRWKRHGSPSVTVRNMSGLYPGNVKKCTRCDEIKPIDEFGVSNQNTGVRRSRCKPCSSAAAAESKKADPARAQRNSLRTRATALGLNPDTMELLFNNHNKLCDLCGKPQSTRGQSRLHMDHDHVTGNFRGWLCGECNTGLGKFKDDPALLARAAQYVRD